MIRYRELGEYVERHGAKKISAQLMEAITAPEKDKAHIDAEENFSIRDLWECFVGATGRTLDHQLVEAMLNYRLTGEDFEEAADGVAAFGQITGQVIRARLIKTYDEVAYVWRELCREEYYAHRDVKVAGLEGAKGAETIVPGAPYPHVGLGSEIYVTGEQEKKGVILDIGEDLIREDRTGQILNWARRQGRKLAADKEKRVVRGVTDTETSPYVFQPNGTGEPLYRTAVGTASSRITKTAAKPLVNHTDLDEALLILAAFKENRDQTGDYLPVPPKLTLAVPMALRATALDIVGAFFIERDDRVAAGAGPGRRGPNRAAGIQVVASPQFDALSTDTWYFGDFKSQFVWNFIKKLFVIEQVKSLPSWWERDTVMEIKRGEYGDLMAEDDCYVVECPGS